MLALVALGERAFKRVEIHALAPQTWVWRQTADAARGTEAKADILCFGDSLMEMGLLPKVIAARTGRPAYNLAIPRGQPASSYYLLRRALRAGARPTAVVVEVAPHLLRLANNGPVEREKWSELLSFTEQFDLARTTRDLDLFIRLTVSRFLPTFRNCHGIRAALRGNGAHALFQAAQYLRNARRNCGAIVNNPVPSTSLSLPANNPHTRALFENFACDPVNSEYLERFVALAEGRGIAVYLLVPPVAVEGQQYAEESGFDAAQTSFVQSLQRRHPGVTVLDARHAGYGRELFLQDLIHLNRFGATVLSDDVAFVLGPSSIDGPSGWVRLPNYRARPIDAPVEDIAETAIAITVGSPVRR